MAEQLTKNEVDKGRYMIYRNKPWISDNDQLVLDFEGKILNYC